VLFRSRDNPEMVNEMDVNRTEHIKTHKSSSSEMKRHVSTPTAGLGLRLRLRLG
jgi:hypothetical protein